MLHRLRNEMGLRVQGCETGSGVGGTWYWNRYPGAGRDSDSYIYRYSFDRALLQQWEWAERYPEQHEILRYLNHVANRLDLRRCIRFDTCVTEASFDGVVSATSATCAVHWPSASGVTSIVARPCLRSSPPPTPGIWEPIFPASRGSSCPISAASDLTGRSGTRSPPTATKDGTSRVMPHRRAGGGLDMASPGR